MNKKILFRQKFLPARVKEKDISPFARQTKNTIFAHNPPAPQLSVIAEYEIIFLPNNGKCYWSVATPIFHVKQTSNSQDTKDLYSAKGSKKKLIVLLMHP